MPWPPYESQLWGTYHTANRRGLHSEQRGTRLLSKFPLSPRPHHSEELSHEKAEEGLSQSVTVALISSQQSG